MREKIRLNKFLQSVGVASRRKADLLIETGKVEVNGEPASLGLMIQPDEDRVTVEGKLCLQPEKLVYFLFHKPKGCICSHQRKQHEVLVIDFFSHCKERLFTIGRLDKESEGLLLLTNDGDFAQKVIHPSSHILKEYHVTVHRKIFPEDLFQLRKGTTIEGTFVKPKAVIQLGPRKLLIKIYEGKKREVRMLTLAANLLTVKLVRMKIGGLALPKIPSGTYRKLSEQERRLIFQ